MRISGKTLREKGSSDFWKGAKAKKEAKMGRHAEQNLVAFWR